MQHSEHKRLEFNDAMLDLGHAEMVPIMELEKSDNDTVFLPMHAVYKASSTTREVFGALAMSSTGVLINDTLLVRLTIHPPLLIS